MFINLISKLSGQTCTIVISMNFPMSVVLQYTLKASTLNHVHYCPDKNQPFLNSTGNGNQIPKGRQSFVNKFSNFGSTIVTIYTFQSKRPRRTRVVPICDHHHQRPSSSMAGRCKSRTTSHFFKIILPSTIQQMKLVSNVSCYNIFQ